MKRSIKLLSGLAALTVVAGCATRPSSIAAASVSDEAYKFMDCAALFKERSRVLSTLTAVSDDQSSKAQRDLVAVAAAQAVSPIFYVMLTGETSGKDEVARLKGEHDAIDRVIARNDCRVPG